MFLFFANVDFGTLALFGLAIVAFIFVIIVQYKNQKKKNEEAEAMNKAIKVGDEVRTIGGVIGKVVEINDADATIEVSSGSGSIVFDRVTVYPIAFFNRQNYLTSNDAVEDFDVDEVENLDVENIEVNDAVEMPAESDETDKTEE